MDYCQSYFGKSISDLTIEDIEIFFGSERSESDHIEFKSINPQGNISEKFPSINKGVTAFLNSGGGIIIWGAPIGQTVEGRREKVFVGNLTYFNEVLEKDFVVSKISDSIISLPKGIRVNVLEKENRCCIIIEVDNSEYAPHQTGNIYYMRIDGQSKPAPHHYIEALFKQVKYPNLEVLFKITNAGVHGDNYRVDFELLFFNWSPLQNEENLSFRIVAENGTFPRSNDPAQAHLYRMKGHEYFKDNLKPFFYYGEPVQDADTIFFNPHRVEQKNNKACLIISFAGRYSPMKTSRYVLDFTKIHANNPNEMIIERQENRLTKDIQDEKGVDKQTAIDMFIKGYKAT